MKTLIVLRHAHREKNLGPETDNGISAKGKKQAKRAAEFFEARFLKAGRPEKSIFISSPKLRCLETLKPLAEKMKSEIQTSSDLDEGGTLLGVPLDLKKGAWAEVEKVGHFSRVTWLVQDFDVF